MFGPDGAVRFYDGIVEDITQSKRVQEALEESEERYRTLFEAANDGVALVKDGRFREINRKVLELFQRSEAEMLGGSPAAFSPERQPDGGLSAERSLELLRLAEGGVPQRYRWNYRRPDQSVFTVEISLNRLALRGENYLLVIMRDITAQLRLEDELRQAQKMEALGRLAGGIAHDFNNLLTVINGYAALLLRKMGRTSPFWTQVEEIAKAGERATRLTQQLLAFSRKQVIQPQLLHLSRVVTDSLEMLRRVIGEHIDLATSLEPRPAAIRADTGQLQQVLMNLVVNARDAMPSGGRMLIATRNVELDGEYCAAHPGTAPGAYVSLAVSDTGIGMDEKTQRHIFEPFFTTKPMGKGTGLGLSTVYGIVRQNQGSIVVASECGKGTTLTIYLPQVAEAAGQPAPEGSSESPPGSGTILLVEDQPAVRRLGAEVLRTLGYHVLEASGGREALQLAQQQEPIHLLLTDVMMPGMNGQELAERMRPLHPEARILFMSGFTADVISRKGLMAPDVDFIPKPFSPEALGTKVRQMLAGRTA